MLFLRVRSALDRGALRKALDDMDCIAFGIGAVLSMQEADLAMHLAEKAFAEKRNIARKPRYEFILWLSGRRDIKSAMEATAPAEGEELFVAVFSDIGEREALGRLKAEKLPLGLEKNADPLRLERISLSRIR